MKNTSNTQINFACKTFLNRLIRHKNLSSCSALVHNHTFINRNYYCSQVCISSRGLIFTGYATILNNNCYEKIIPFSDIIVLQGWYPYKTERDPCSSNYKNAGQSVNPHQHYTMPRSPHFIYPNIFHRTDENLSYDP